MHLILKLSAEVAVIVTILFSTATNNPQARCKTGHLTAFKVHTQYANINPNVSPSDYGTISHNPPHFQPFAFTIMG